MPSTYLITGVSRGIGAEFARQFTHRGEIVIGTVRDAAAAAEKPDHPSSIVDLELTDEKSIESLPARVGDRAVDVLINNAGVSSETGTLDKCGMDELLRVFTINSIAPVLVAKAMRGHLRRGGRKVIVNVSSQLGSIARHGGGSSYGYRASKTALNMLTVCMHHELKGEGFTCIAVHPGWVRTDMGGPGAPLTPEESVTALVALIDRLTPADGGKYFSYDGSEIPW